MQPSQDKQSLQTLFTEWLFTWEGPHPECQKLYHHTLSTFFIILPDLVYTDSDRDKCVFFNMISRFDYLEEMRTFNCLRLEYTHKPFQENVEVDSSK